MQSLWAKFNNWCRNSGTIIWARVQVVIGSIWFGLSSTDLAPLLDPKKLVYWLIINGVVTELIRRSGTTTHTVTADDGSQMTILKSTNPAAAVSDEVATDQKGK